MAVTEKAHLQRFFEAVAAIMELDRGRQRLELIFEDGRLVEWFVHRERKPPAELGSFDRDSGWLVARSDAA